MYKREKILKKLIITIRNIVDKKMSENISLLMYLDLYTNLTKNKLKTMTEKLKTIKKDFGANFIGFGKLLNNFLLRPPAHEKVIIKTIKLIEKRIISLKLISVTKLNMILKHPKDGEKLDGPKIQITISPLGVSPSGLIC